jgi:PAS domain S-box-containing protein
VSLAWRGVDADGEGTERPSGLILAATTPVPGADGTHAGVLLARVDLFPTIEAARSPLGRAANLLIIDERGAPLLVPASPPRLDLGGAAAPSILPGSLGGAFSQVPGVDGVHLAYVTTRSWDPGDPDRRLIFVLNEPEPKPEDTLDVLRRANLLAALGLVVLAILMVGVLLRRQTRPLSALAGASEAIARGDFSRELPPADSSEVGSLVRAFRHMAEEVERREGQLAALNLDLERRVEARTAELAREHALQRLILDSVADGVVVVDLAGRFVLWNRKAEQIVGSGPEAVPSERWSEHFGVYRDEAGEPVPTEELPLVRAIHGESTDNMEVYLCRPKRSEGRWAQVTARPLRDQDGGLSGAVAVLVDVTERRRMEARLQARRAELARFGRLVLGAEIASVTAHQLSQPLAALSNYVGAALRLHQRGRLHEPELGEMLERIERLSVQAGAILDRLRARIRRGESPPKAFDVDAVVTSCLDFLGDRIQRAGVRVQRRCEASLPAVQGDPLQLEHALIQLVTNALEAMETIDRSQRQLIVGMHHDASRGMLIIEIGDTGPGVSAALADRLFRPWETDKPGALGIGLTIVESIIESFGGSIRMEPGIPRGARFSIALPEVARGEA